MNRVMEVKIQITFIRSLAPNFFQPPILMSCCRELRSFSGSKTSSKQSEMSRTKALKELWSSSEWTGMMVSVGIIAGLAGLLLKIPIVPSLDHS